MPQVECVALDGTTKLIDMDKISLRAAVYGIMLHDGTTIRRNQQTTAYTCSLYVSQNPLI